MLGDSAEEGVVMGSLTLGGDWPKNVKKIRALSEEGSDAAAAEERRLKKRAR